MENGAVWTYRITHDNDPQIINGNLELGHEECMKKIRPYAKEGEWVIARLGKTFYTRLNGEYDFDKTKYLVYAMKITKIFEQDNKIILRSDAGNYYCFFETPIQIPQKFYEILTKGQAPNKKPYSEARAFIDWIKEQEPNFGSHFRGVNKESVKTCSECKPSAHKVC